MHVRTYLDVMLGGDPQSLQLQQVTALIFLRLLCTQDVVVQQPIHAQQARLPTWDPVPPVLLQESFDMLIS